MNIKHKRNYKTENSLKQSSYQENTKVNSNIQMNHTDRINSRLNEKIKSEDPEIELYNNSTCSIGKEKCDENNMTFYSKSEVKEKISTIYKNFAKYSKEEKSFSITLSALIRMIKNLNLFNETYLKMNDIDIIFKQVSQSNKLNEIQFSNFIVKLAEKLYQKEYKLDKKECVNSLIINVFEPYSKSLENEEIDIELPITEFTQKVIHKIINYPIDSYLSGILNSIFYTLREIYLRYFELELTMNKDLEKIEEDSLKSLTEFCKDFVILPYIINFDQLTSYYKEIIKFHPKEKDFGFVLDNKRELGSCFTLNKFCLLFVHFSLIYYSKTNSRKIKSKVSDVDKLILFLERLENTDGLRNLEKKRSRPHSIKITFIPSRDILVMTDCNLLYKNENPNENYFNKTTHKINTTCSKKFNDNEKASLRNLLSIKGDIYELIHSKIEAIKEIFIYYSEMGDKLNFDRMSISSFSKFLHDCGLITDLNKESKSFEISQINKTKTFSKSPVKKKNLDEDNLSSTDFKSVNKIVNFKQFQGKLSQSDVNIIYFNLTGPKNFDNSLEIKNQFNKNSGFTGSFEGNLTKAIILDKKDVVKSSNTMMTSKLDFLLFIKSFELISTKIYPDLNLDMAVDKFLKNNLSKILDNSKSSTINKELSQVMEKLLDAHIQDFIDECNHIMLDLFKFYANSNNLLTFEQFFDLYKDFSLFPDLINLVQLKTIFYLVSEKYSNEQKSNLKTFQSVDKSFISSSEVDSSRALNYVKNDFLNFRLFLESLAVTAMLYNSKNDWTDMDRILYLIMKIHQSKGMKNLKISIGKTSNLSKDILGYMLKLKEKYPQLKVVKRNDVNIKEKNLFDEIYG